MYLIYSESQLVHVIKNIPDSILFIQYCFEFRQAYGYEYILGYFSMTRVPDVTSSYPVYFPSSAIRAARMLCTALRVAVQALEVNSLIAASSWANLTNSSKASCNVQNVKQCSKDPY